MDLLKDQMTKPLQDIEAIQQKQLLDASGYSLAVCERILSTHSQSDWRTLNPVRAQHAKLKRDELKAVDLPDSLNVIEVDPADIKPDMLIKNHGHIGKVKKVNRYRDEDINEPWIYAVKYEYVSGNLETFNYFIERINNGCDKGYLATQQGNNRAKWYIVSDETKSKQNRLIDIISDLSKFKTDKELIEYIIRNTHAIAEANDYCDCQHEAKKISAEMTLFRALEANYAANIRDGMSQNHYDNLIEEY